MTRIAALLTTIGAVTLGCSSQTFSTANADAGSSIGGSDTGGAQSGGASGSGGRGSAGTQSGGASGLGGRGSGGTGSGGAPGSGGCNGSTTTVAYYSPACDGTAFPVCVELLTACFCDGTTIVNGGSTKPFRHFGPCSSPDSGVITADGGVVTSDSGVISPDGGAVGIRCNGSNPTFPTFEKGCTNDASCVLVRHTTSCCGSQLFMGINHAELTRFQAAESICDAQYPGCGCASQGANAEDGTLVPWGSENLIAVSCMNGACQSHYTGKTFPCGTATCTDQQYCSTFTGGPAGSPTSYNCAFLGGCSSCSCIGNPGCVCSQDQGFIKVSCAAP